MFLTLPNKKITISFFLLFGPLLFTSARAQETSPYRINDEEIKTTLLTNNFIGFSVAPVLVEKAIIKRHSDKYNVHATPQGGIEAGFDYHYYIDKRYSLIAGLHFGTSGRNILYSVPKDDFDPPTKADITAEGLPAREFDVSYLSLPVFFERRWLKNSHGLWNINLGFNVRYAPFAFDASEGASVLDSNWQAYHFFDLELAFGNNKKPWINYNIGGGYSRILNNNNIFRVNLLSNFSFTQFVNGAYEFALPNQPPEKGTYGIKGSSLGLSLSYILTGANKRLSKLRKK